MSGPKKEWSLDNAKELSRDILFPPKAEKAWIQLEEITFMNAAKERQKYGCASRRVNEGHSTQAVGSVAVYEDGGKSKPMIVVQKQYRAPVGKVTIEFPAGMKKTNEDFRKCAINELEEETGYHGTIDEKHGDLVLSCDPGFCSTTYQIVRMSIDKSKSENQNLVPKPEKDEYIQKIDVPMQDLYRHCVEWQKEGCAIDGRVGAFAEGIEAAKTLLGDTHGHDLHSLRAHLPSILPTLPKAHENILHPHIGHQHEDKSPEAE